MIRGVHILGITFFFTVFVACASGYKAKPLPFKAAASYANAIEMAGATVAAKAFVNPREAREAFGFDVRGAGMLPVQVVFDNQGPHALEINAVQTFLEDAEGNLWPVLASKTAYERATKYSQTKQIFKEGAYGGFLGETAGALIGATVGVVTGENVGVPPARELQPEPRLEGQRDMPPVMRVMPSSKICRRSLWKTKRFSPRALLTGSYFPRRGEVCKTALRMQLLGVDTGTVQILKLNL